MKTNKLFRPRSLAAALAVLAFLLLQFAAPSAFAVTYYWDSDDTNPGFGSTTGTWGTSAFWTVTATGDSPHSGVTLTTTNDGVNFGSATLNYGNAAVDVAAGGVSVNSITFGAGQTTGLTLGTANTITLGGTTPTITQNSASTMTIGSILAGTAGLTKAGTGNLTLSGLSATAANNYSGTTIIDNGTLAITTTSPTLSGGLTFGASATTPNVGALDLSGASATFVNLSVQTTNATATNVITIGSGQTLTHTGSTAANVINVGINSSVLAPPVSSKLRVTGANGTLTVNDPSRNVVVSTIRTNTGSGPQVLDLSGLGTFNATIKDLAVGRPTSAAGAATTGIVSEDTLFLAATNTINATNIIVSSTPLSPNGTFRAWMNLGTVNTLNAATFVVGASRGVGTIKFNTGLTAPTVTIRGASGGTSRTSIYLGDQSDVRNTSTTGGGSATSTGTMDFTAGTLDALIGTLYVGYGATGTGGTFGAGNGVFAFDGAASVVDINTLVIGQNQNLAASTATSKTSSIGTFTMNDGSLTVNTGMTLASDSDAVAGSTVQSVLGTFNLAGGNATITPGIIMGTHTSTGTGTSTARLNLTGGTLSVGNNIREGTLGSGVINSSITNNGATLNLNGRNITSIDNITYISGLITNLGVVNTGMTLAGTGSREFGQDTGVSGTIQGAVSGSGVGLTKTGGGTLTLSGALSYDGPTTVNGGKLVVSSTHSGSGAATVSANATLGVTASGANQWSPASLTLTNPCTLEFNSVQNPNVSTAPIVPGTAISSPSPGVVINVNGFSVAAMPGSKYPLLGNITDTNGISLGTEPTSVGVSGHLEWDGTTLYYMVDSAPDVWAGTDGVNPTFWDISTSLNWIGKASINTPSGSYTNNDTVLFNDTAATNAVSIEAAVTPGGVTFENSSLNYTVTSGSANGIGGNGGLTKRGSGTVTLSTANSYSGPTTISAGTLQLGAGGTTGSLSPSSAITNNATVAVNRTDTVTQGTDFASVISGSGNVNNLGTGTLLLTGANTFTGNLLVSAGTVQLGADDRLAAGAGLDLAANGTTSAILDLNSYDQTLSRMVFSAVNAAGNLTIAGGANSKLTINATTDTELGPNGTINAARDVTTDMSGLGEFVWNGLTNVFRVGLRIGAANAAGTPPGTFTTTLASTNTIKAATLAVGTQGASNHGGSNELHLGQTSVLNVNSLLVGTAGRCFATLDFRTGLTDPTVKIRGTNAPNDATARVTTWDVGLVAHFGNSTWAATNDFSAGQLDARASSLRIGRADTATQTGRAGIQNSYFTMGKGTLDVTTLIVGQYNSGAGGSIAASGTFAGNGTFDLSDAAGTVTAENVILADNVGTATLNAGAVVNVSGTFNLNAGTVEAKTIDKGADSGNATSVTRNFNFSGGTVRNYPGFNLAIANVPLNLTGSGPRNFEATAGQTITVASVISDSGSGQGFTKQGAGTLALSGVNTYTGPTIISAGTLLVNSPGSIDAASAVTVNTNATLGGTGTINGSVTVADGGNLAPGASAGTLSIGGNLDISAQAAGTTGKLRYELDALAGPNDLVAVGGTLTIGAGVLGFSDFAFSNLGGLQAGTYKLITSGGISGTLAGGGTNGTIGSFNASLQLNGNDLELVVTGGSGAPSPTLLTNSVSGSTLSLSWPAGQGWKLQQQTNALSKGLGTNWVDVTPGSASSTNIPLNKITPATFYRLVYP